MELLKKINLLLIFYRNFWLANTLITAICGFLLWEYGYSIYAMLFWLKISTLFIIYRFVNTYKKQEFYYYQNLGLSKMVLWVSTFSFDMLAYFFLLSQVNKFQ
jgi:hypothetical protein